MSKGTVLVVDDDPEIVAFVQLALEDEGYGVLTGLNGEALSLAHDKQPALILLDIMMPGMDGIEMSRRLRDDPVTSNIPIIAMSAQSRLRTTGTLMPVNDRLPKPFTLENLYAKVAHWSRAS